MDQGSDIYNCYELSSVQQESLEAVSYHFTTLSMPDTISSGIPVRIGIFAPGSRQIRSADDDVGITSPEFPQSCPDHASLSSKNPDSDANSTISTNCSLDLDKDVPSISSGPSALSRSTGRSSSESEAAFDQTGLSRASWVSQEYDILGQDINDFSEDASYSLPGVHGRSASSDLEANRDETRLRLDREAVLWRTKLCERIDDSNLPSAGPAISDFLCVHRLFNEAFELNYWMLLQLAPKSSSQSETFTSAILTCMKTATTPSQQQIMLDVADTILSLLEKDMDSSHWLIMALKLYKGGLSPWSVKPSEAFHPLCDYLREGGKLTLMSMNEEGPTKWRECTELVLRARTMYSQTPVISWTLEDYWMNPSIAELSLKLSQNQKLSRMGEHLLTWFQALLKRDRMRLDMNVWRYTGLKHMVARRSCTSSQYREAKADDLCLFLLRQWHTEPCKSIKPCGRNATELDLPPFYCDMDQSRHFNLFYLMAAFSHLLVESLPGSGRGSELSSKIMLSTMASQLGRASFFNQRLVTEYWSRLCTKAMTIGIAQYRSRHEYWTDVLFDYASDWVLPGKIKNFEICDIHSDLLDVPHPSTQELRPLSFNDPVLGRRDSISSSLRSHLSAIRPSRMSSLSRDKRASGASSGAMSIDSDPSGRWRLSSFLPIFDRESDRGSVMDVDAPMSSIQE